MAYRTYFRSVLNDNFKILTWILILFIAITPNFIFINSVHASAAEKWEVLENNYDHVSNKVKIEARKITQEAANSARYKVEVPVNSSALGKTVKGMFWAGVAVAGVEAMLQGIGWVIDYGSQVIKRPKEEVNDPALGQYVFRPVGGYTCGLTTLFYSSSAATASAAACYAKSKKGTYSISYSADKKTFYVHFVNSNNSSDKDISIYDVSINPQYDPSKPTEFEYLSDSELGNEIVGKGENSQPLPGAVEDAYSPHNPLDTEPAPQATQDALDNANPQPDTEPVGDSKPKPNVDTDADGEMDAYDPAKPAEGTEFQLPNFCAWAPAVCDFFTVQKSDNKDIKNNQREQIEQDKSFFDWFKEMPDSSEDGQLQIDDQSIIFDDSQRISFSSSCPVSEKFSVSFFGATQNLEFSYQPLCDFMSMIKPFVIAGSYLIGAYIVMGLSRGNAD